MRICMPLVVENHQDVSGDPKPQENGPLSPMDLPGDYARGPEDGARRGEKDFSLQGAPDEQMVRAAFEVLLRRYCGEADGTPFEQLVKHNGPPHTNDLTLEW